MHLKNQFSVTRAVLLNRRQSLVGELLAQPSRLAEVHELLGTVRDIPRILGRLQNRLRNPRELGGVKDTLAQIPAIMACLDLLTRSSR